MSVILLRSCLGMKKVPPLFLTVVIFSFLISLPFVHCSTSTRIYRTSIAGPGSRLITTIEVAGFRNFEGPSSSSVGTVEESARKIPTGPDPLHHNNNPFEP